MIETLTWKGLVYTTKPFTLDTLYTFGELTKIGENNGRVVRATFEAGCSVLLQGTTAEAVTFAESGKLAKDVLMSTEAEKAVAFKRQVDFLSLAFVKRGQGLIPSDPNSTDTLAPIPAKASRRKRP